MAATYTLISSNVLASSAASVTFSAIPSTYTDLVVRSSTRGDTAGVTNVAAKLQFNGDTSIANYSETYIQGNGSAASSSAGAGNGYINLNRFSDGSTATANTFASNEIYIPSYTASQKKPISRFGAHEDNVTQAWLHATAGLYQGTSAISSITITSSTDNFVSGSSFYLYGIKNS